MVYFSSLYLDNYFRCAILANQNKNRTLTTDHASANRRSGSAKKARLTRFWLVLVKVRFWPIFAKHHFGYLEIKPKHNGFPQNRP